MQKNQIKQRNPWKKEEDQALIHLKQILKIKRWSFISERIPNRDQKQCRDRYENNLKHRNVEKKWSDQHQRQLISLYFKHGSNWQFISTKFENVNAAFIKNKFYARLKKGIRIMNTIIQSHMSQFWGKFNENIVFKLIQAETNKYDSSQKNPLGKRIVKNITYIKNILQKVYFISDSFQQLFKQTKQKIQLSVYITTLIEDLNFVDENLGEKHSNKISSININSRQIQPQINNNIQQLTKISTKNINQQNNKLESNQEGIKYFDMLFNPTKSLNSKVNKKITVVSLSSHINDSDQQSQQQINTQQMAKNQFYQNQEHQNMISPNKSFLKQASYRQCANNHNMYELKDYKQKCLNIQKQQKIKQFQFNEKQVKVQQKLPQPSCTLFFKQPSI